MSSASSAQTGSVREKRFEETVLIRKEQGVGWITLNRPAVLNALDSDTLEKLHSTLRETENDPAVRCLVITGSGRAFCAGADLASLRKRETSEKFSFADDLRQHFNPMISRIRNMEKPVIAMVNGVAAGAGMGLAFACDLRLMSESASFVEAFAKLGLVPDSGCTFLMPRLLGMARAMELGFTGEAIDAPQSARIGLVNRVVPPDKLAQETRQLAEKLARGPRGAGLSKRAINRALSMDLDSALEYEAYLQEIAGGTEDYKEGVTAFLEKRKPDFKGR